LLDIAAPHAASPLLLLIFDAAMILTPDRLFSPPASARAFYAFISFAPCLLLRYTMLERVLSLLGAMSAEGGARYSACSVLI